MPVPVMPATSHGHKRKSSATPIEPQPKRLAPYNALESVPPAAPSPPPNPHPVPPQFQLPPIQPQPPSTANGLQAKPPTPNLPAAIIPPKRRGRPPRSNRNKELRPNLPQRLTPLAPQPSPPAVSTVNANSSPLFGTASIANTTAGSASSTLKAAPLRPIQIAPGPRPKDVTEYSPITPIAGYSASPATSGVGLPLPRKGGRPVSIAKAPPGAQENETGPDSVASNRS